MRIRDEHIEKLQNLLKDIGIESSDEETQEHGLAIMQFALRKQYFEKLMEENEGNEYEHGDGTKRSAKEQERNIPRGW